MAGTEDSAAPVAGESGITLGEVAARLGRACPGMSAEEAQERVRQACRTGRLTVTKSPAFLQLEASCTADKSGGELAAISDQIESVIWHEVHADPVDVVWWIARHAARWPATAGPWWDLTMTRVWIMTRDAGFVRAIAIEPSPFVRRLILMRLDREREDGRSVGWVKEELHRELRKGGLVAEGRRPGEATCRAIPPGEWLALERSLGGDCTVRYEGLRFDAARVGLWKPEAVPGAPQPLAATPSTVADRPAETTAQGCRKRGPRVIRQAAA